MFVAFDEQLPPLIAWQVLQARLRVRQGAGAFGASLSRARCTRLIAIVSWSAALNTLRCKATSRFCRVATSLATRSRSTQAANAGRLAVL